MMASERGAKAHSVRDIRRTFRQGLWVAVAIMIPIWLVLWQAETVLLTLGQQAELASKAQSYVRAYMWSILPFLWLIIARNFLSALEQPMWSLVMGIMGVFANGAFNYVLIFGKLGLPPLGLVGAGIAIDDKDPDAYIPSLGFNGMGSAHPVHRRLDLAAIGRLQIIGPLKPELEAQRFLDVRAQGEPHPEREGLQPFRRDEGTEGQREVEITGRRAVPLAAETSASGLLRPGQHRERRFLADGEATLRFGVGAVDLGEELDLRRDLQQPEMRIEQRRIEMTWDRAQRVTLAGRGREHVADGAETLEPAPDRHARDAELLGEAVAADRFAVRFEEGQEDTAVEVRHEVRASRGRGRTTAPRG